MTVALIAFITLAVLAARLDYVATREALPTHPHDDLLHRQTNAHRDIVTHRGERSRSADDLLHSFDPSFLTVTVSVADSASSTETRTQ